MKTHQPTNNLTHSPIACILHENGKRERKQNLNLPLRLYLAR